MKEMAQEETALDAARLKQSMFVASKTDPKAGNWVKATCGGHFAFRQKALSRQPPH